MVAVLLVLGVDEVAVVLYVASTSALISVVIYYQ